MMSLNKPEPSGLRVNNININKICTVVLAACPAIFDSQVSSQETQESAFMQLGAQTRLRALSKFRRVLLRPRPRGQIRSDLWIASFCSSWGRRRHRR